MANEVRWIDRDKDGKICGYYARKQRDGQEFLPEDDPELLARDAETRAQMEAAQKVTLDKDALILDLKARLDASDLKIAEMDASLKSLKSGR